MHYLKILKIHNNVKMSFCGCFASPQKISFTKYFHYKYIYQNQFV